MTDFVNNAAVGDASLDAVGVLRRQRNLLARSRYQLLGALIVVIGLPAVVRHGIHIGALSFNAEQNTLLATLVAMLLGAYLRHRLAAFPGQRVVASVMPAFGTAYGLVALCIFFLRLDYSRFQLGASFGLALVWFGVIAALEPRVRRQRLFVVPAGRALLLTASRAADWVVGRTPDSVAPNINGIVADLRADLSSEWTEFLARAAIAGVPVYHWKQLVERFTGTVEIEYLVENSFSSSLQLSVYPRLKRLIDLAISVLAMPLVAPAIALVGLAILICDGRPVFFRQTRVGYRGRSFTIMKFRTMRAGSENGQRFTTENDPRVTRLGRTLRRCRLDELPQVFNVIRGEMSWIGPRPESKELGDWYQAQVPFYSYRHIVRPGITGWAQVHQGNVAEIDAATDKLRYDFYYIKYLSPWLDFAILLQTVRIILNGFGSR
jgi:lipopolysaccharide/colanic/teichoic acid biosynthesis glycosyltransferase